MRIFVTLTFPAVHRYPDAPEPVAYLSQPHRHLFRVRADIEVFHDDREIEFMLCQAVIASYIDHLPFDLGSTSCEQLASAILNLLHREYGAERRITVEVSEDGENGAIVP